MFSGSILETESINIPAGIESLFIIESFCCKVSVTGVTSESVPVCAAEKRLIINKEIVNEKKCFKANCYAAKILSGFIGV